MQIVAQSQTPAKAGYIHLAYLAAQLSNGISRGELVSGQAYLGIALATAVLCGVARTKLKGMRRMTVGSFAVLGFCAALTALWLIEHLWRAQRTDAEVLQHVVRTKQYWALREPKLGAAIEAAAETNGVAASLAARYYALKRSSENPEFTVKAFWFAERAVSSGESAPWVRTNELATGYLEQPFQAGLESGKLSSAQAEWTKGKLAQMTQLFEEPDVGEKTSVFKPEP